MATHPTTKKKIVVFDLDETVADLKGFILPHLNMRAGTNFTDLTHFNWEEQFNLPRAELQQVLIDQQYMMHLKLRSGMIKYWFEALRINKWTVHFSTHRAHLPFAHEMTKMWLDSYPFLKHEKLMILHPDQRKADHFSPATCLYFDDSAKEVEYAQSKGIKSWLIQQPWNMHSEHPHVCKSIEDVQCAIQWARGPT
jgi:5'(3')-deoxyribonucleotidase